MKKMAKPSPLQAFVHHLHRDTASAAVLVVVVVMVVMVVTVIKAEVMKIRVSVGTTALFDGFLVLSAVVVVGVVKTEVKKMVQSESM